MYGYGLKQKQKLIRPHKKEKEKNSRVFSVAMAAALSCHFHHYASNYISQNVKTNRTKRFVSCSMNPPQNNIKVIINGAAKEIGRAAVIAVTKARGMEVAGAVDSHFVGEDIGQVSLCIIFSYAMFGNMLGFENFPREKGSSF